MDLIVVKENCVYCKKELFDSEVFFHLSCKSEIDKFDSSQFKPQKWLVETVTYPDGSTYHYFSLNPDYIETEEERLQEIEEYNRINRQYYPLYDGIADLTITDRDTPDYFVNFITGVGFNTNSKVETNNYIKREDMKKFKDETKLKRVFTCERCGFLLSGSKLLVHHKIEVEMNGELWNKDFNVVCLCYSCHQTIHYYRSKNLGFFVVEFPNINKKTLYEFL